MREGKSLIKAWVKKAEGSSTAISYGRLELVKIARGY